MTTHGYSRARWLVSIIGDDLVLVAVLVAIAVARPPGPFPKVLALGIVAVLAWQLVTLHYPSRVEVTESGVTFFGYGRAHRFAWEQIRECRVRRFLVRDRVLVRVLPSSPFRGRYWILDSIEGFDELLKKLEKKP
jgi:hypothetical protein